MFVYSARLTMERYVLTNTGETQLNEHAQVGETPPVQRMPCRRWDIEDAVDNRGQRNKVE